MADQFPDLSVKIFDDFVLSNPFWIASSHYTGNKNAIEGWHPYNPAALTLKTSSLTQGGDGKTGKRDKRSLVNSISFYSDGPRSLEFVDGPTTETLLRHALDCLPTTKIGVSILEAEPYRDLKRYIDGAHFVELNFKYSGRITPENTGKSYLQLQAQKHREIIQTVLEFSDEFEKLPQFLKMSRDFPWLRPCAEWNELSTTITDLMKKGRRIGLVIANSRRTRIPSSLLTRKEDSRKVTELSSGVLMGEELWLDTYDLIRQIRLESTNTDTVPIIASGGILGIREFIDSIYAGACAVQLCSAFDEYGTVHYPWLLIQLGELIKRSSAGSARRLCRVLEHGNELEVARIYGVYYELASDFNAYIRRRLETQRDKIIDCVVKAALAEATLTVEHLNNLKLGRPFPSLYFPVVQETAQGTALMPGTILSLVTSPYVHALFATLQERLDSKVTLVNFTDSSAVVAEMKKTQEWDLAVVSEANVPEGTVELSTATESVVAPIILGKLGWTKYFLLSSADHIKQIRTIYDFAGTQSRSALRSAIKVDGSDNYTPTFKQIRKIARLIQVAPPSIAIFAKPPLSEIYKLLASENNVTLKEHAAVEVAYVLIASPRFYEKAKANMSLKHLWEQFQQVLDNMVSGQIDLSGVFRKDGSFERLLRYLEEDNKGAVALDDE